jgi:hypothetical protein
VKRYFSGWSILNDRRAYREQASQQTSCGNDGAIAQTAYGTAGKFIPLTSNTSVTPIATTR